jgi:hypothetical protein
MMGMEVWRAGADLWIIVDEIDALQRRRPGSILSSSGHTFAAGASGASQSRHADSFRRPVGPAPRIR